MELKDGLRNRSFSGIIETKINPQCMQEYLGSSEG